MCKFTPQIKYYYICYNRVCNYTHCALHGNEYLMFDILAFGLENLPFCKLKREKMQLMKA